MDLFDYSLKDQIRENAPLADRMRPRTLDEFVGQSHILSPGRLLRRAIQADQLSSLIFFGPPGTGKTTLAKIIANTTKAEFISLNAVLSGVKDIRSSIASAERHRKEYERKTILFIDEVHRFNKAQQDALLPHVENGTVVLIGATTENPYFEVNKALVSRSRIFQLNSLQQKDLQEILKMALKDSERGFGKLKVEITEEASDHLTNTANGDARAVLNALELAIMTSEEDSSGVIRIDLEISEESIQKKAVLYDKDGDAHFDTISAFIKSVRGSDPDAALYWLAKMVYGGEDPRFLFRRMIILASEDIGMADPNALRVVMSAAQAFDYVGMPEGRFHLAEACLYLATAPKSNSGFAFFDALEAVAKEKQGGVPDHLKDGNRDKEGLGHGKGYLYPHAYQDHWVAQQYLPDNLQGRVFYQPSGQGYEAAIKKQVSRFREVQMASVLESTDRERDDQELYWQSRTFGNTAQLLGEIRDYLFSNIKVNRQDLVLVLNAQDGILLGEALREAEEGGVFGLVKSIEEKIVLENRFKAFDYLSRPVIRNTEAELPTQLEALIQEGVCFQSILGLNFLATGDLSSAVFSQLRELLDKKGKIGLVDSLPAEGQKLSDLIPSGTISESLHAKMQKAEKAIYQQATEVNRFRQPEILPAELRAQGFEVEANRTTEFFNSTIISRSKLNDWFKPGENGRKTYADYLKAELNDSEVIRVKSVLQTAICGKPIKWKSVWLFVKAVKQP